MSRVARMLLVAAVALVCFTNVGALAVGALNRRTVTSEVVLTERELRLVSLRSSLTLLRIQWMQPSPVYFRDQFVSRAGFGSPPTHPEPAMIDHVRREAHRQVYIALEYDGPAWRHYRNTVLMREPQPGPAAPLLTPPQIEQQRRTREQTIAGHSRLFAVDVDRDPARLRGRHPDRSRVLIVHARASLAVMHEKGWPALAVSITQLTPDEVNVPRPFSVALRELTQSQVSSYGDALPGTPRYSVRLRYGRSHEPWIADLSR